MPHSIKIMAILVAKPAKTEDLRALLDGLLTPSRSEAGNLRFDLWVDQAEPGRFILDELYASDEAIASHRSTPHFQHYLSRINDLADRTALVLDPVSVA